MLNVTCIKFDKVYNKSQQNWKIQTNFKHNVEDVVAGFWFSQASNWDDQKLSP